MKDFNVTFYFADKTQQVVGCCAESPVIALIRANTLFASLDDLLRDPDDAVAVLVELV